MKENLDKIITKISHACQQIERIYQIKQSKIEELSSKLKAQEKKCISFSKSPSQPQTLSKGPKETGIPIAASGLKIKPLMSAKSVQANPSNPLSIFNIILLNTKYQGLILGSDNPGNLTNEFPSKTNAELIKEMNKISDQAQKVKEKQGEVDQPFKDHCKGLLEGGPYHYFQTGETYRGQFVDKKEKDSEPASTQMARSTRATGISTRDTGQGD